MQRVNENQRLWYRRTFTVPAEWKGKRILLHFGAVDWEATVWVNGRGLKPIGDGGYSFETLNPAAEPHRGGYDAFTFDISDALNPDGVQEIVVSVWDPTDAGPQPRGKQVRNPHGIWYTPTTGIWQTVWMEPVPDIALRRPRITPDVANGILRLEQPITNNTPGLRLRVKLSDAHGEVLTAETRADLDFAPHLDLPIPESRRRLWSIGDPHLYDLHIELVDESSRVVDSAQSYAGLRSIAIDGKAVKINGEVVFQRLVLDQGYYPDGIMTAPSDEALRQDIVLSQQAGFNGARLHQKVFEERFLYHADQLGYIVWGEFGDWGCGRYGPTDGEHQKPGPDYITQWLEALERDYSHPAIVGWCPLNETWQSLLDRITLLDDVTRGMFLATKAMDATRPVLDTSGYSHRVPEADIYDSHDYVQDPDKLAQRHAGLTTGSPYVNAPSQWDIPPRFGGSTVWSIPYRGQPYFVSEFGGIWWNPDVKEGEDSWGYGERPRSLGEFYDRFERLCAVLLDDPNMFGYCYTQLTDIYQEQNGIYRYDRSLKFDMERIRAAQQRPAAIEQLAAEQ